LAVRRWPQTLAANFINKLSKNFPQQNPRTIPHNWIDWEQQIPRSLSPLARLRTARNDSYLNHRQDSKNIVGAQPKVIHVSFLPKFWQAEKLRLSVSVQVRTNDCS